MVILRTAAIAAFLALRALPAPAAECAQDHAVYADSKGAYTLSFEPVDLNSSSSTHRFSIKVKNGGAVLDGYVMPSDAVERTNGMLFYNCPEGDATGSDLAACTVWQGVIYGNDQGKIELLPQQGAKAAAEILLPGFGPALQASDAWKKIKATVVPWDVLTLKGCS
jgi:hypothetical protein